MQVNKKRIIKHSDLPNLEQALKYPLGLIMLTNHQGVCISMFYTSSITIIT